MKELRERQQYYLQKIFRRSFCKMHRKVEEWKQMKVECFCEGRKEWPKVEYIPLRKTEVAVTAEAQEKVP